MKKKLFAVLLLTSIYIASGQSSTLEGTITEEESKVALSNAIVSLYGTTLITRTDANGGFSFTTNLPFGEQILNISKDGYEEQFVPIDIAVGQKLVLDVALGLTKKEKKRRKRLIKDLAKEEKRKEKATEKALEKARKAKAKEEKRLAKARKKAAKKNGGIMVVYKPLEENSALSDGPGKKTEEAGQKTLVMNDEEAMIKRKYAKELGVSPDEITNLPLYEFIDEWYDAPYKMGGHDQDGIDCSAFTQKLLSAVFNYVPERTAQTMFDGGKKDGELYSDISAIRTGDLIFFNETASEFDEINHVGIYLEHGYFVHSASNRDTDGKNGVQISKLDHPKWKRKMVAWRRMKM